MVVFKIKKDVEVSRKSNSSASILKLKWTQYNVDVKIKQKCDVYFESTYVVAIAVMSISLNVKLIYYIYLV